MNIFKLFKIWYWKNKYKPNTVVWEFVARDVRIDVKIISTDNIENGFIMAQIKTYNILYVSNKLTNKSEYGPPMEIHIPDLWKWTGENWGGLPDGTSLAQRLLNQKSAQQGDAPEPDSCRSCLSDTTSRPGDL